VEAEVEQVGGGHVDVLATPVELVRPLAQYRAEHLVADGDQAGVGDPRAVEAVAGLALLVRTHLRRSRHGVTSGSRRPGRNALIPPMAKAPRLVARGTSSSV
jgi:hypothetical protein